MIIFNKVGKQYRRTNKHALQGVSFEIAAGEFVYLVGTSGSGKSTLLKLMIREEKPTEGGLYVLGGNVSRMSQNGVQKYRQKIGTVFQDFKLLPDKTVYDNVAFSLEVIGKSRAYMRDAIPDVLTMVGLANKSDKHPNELSGGEQQRVAIARAVVNKPYILLADEPTGNLDPKTSAGIMKLLERINKSGTTVIMATHDVNLVDGNRKRVIEMRDGKILRDEHDAQYVQQR